MSGLRFFSGTVFDAANKVRGCLRQPIFNDCMASTRRGLGIEGVGESGGAGGRAGGRCRTRESERDTETKIEAPDSGLRMKWN